MHTLIVTDYSMYKIISPCKEKLFTPYYVTVNAKVGPVLDYTGLYHSHDPSNDLGKVNRVVIIYSTSKFKMIFFNFKNTQYIFE